MNISKRIAVSAALILTIGSGGIFLARPWADRHQTVTPVPEAATVVEVEPPTENPTLPTVSEPNQPPAAPQSVSVEPAVAAQPTTPPIVRPSETAEQRPNDIGNRGGAPSRSASQDLNTWVLDVLDDYQGRSYPYLLNTDYANYNGVTTNISYKGSLIAKANPNGNRASHCTGITFEVFFKAMQARNRDLGISINDFNGMSVSDLRNFLQLWYVAGPKSSNNLAIAIERYGLGKRIHSFADAKAGDFIDFSRNNGTGHTAVFINWIYQNGEIVGFKYWSSQSSTNGISYNTEYFAPKGSVSKSPVYIARVGSVTNYK